MVDEIEDILENKKDFTEENQLSSCQTDRTCRKGCLKVVLSQFRSKKSHER